MWMPHQVHSQWEESLSSSSSLLVAAIAGADRGLSRFGLAPLTPARGENFRSGTQGEKVLDFMDHDDVLNMPSNPDEFKSRGEYFLKFYI